MISDTIAAISTAMGEGGIAVIRVSGPDAVKKAEVLFRSRDKLSEAATHTVHYGHITDPSTGETVDEVLVTIMRAPRSFTTEDVVEISCHGGLVSVRRILDLLLENGVRLAEPGEFTKRAFINGRIDLSQAEAVIDLIRSKSDRAHRLAIKQAEGSLSREIGPLRHQLIELMAHIEVNIDYPEHDVAEMTNALILDQCQQATVAIDRLLLTSRQGKILREGIVTAIIGRPNVGKSSLLNALARESRAIVTDIPGTTRDVIEEYINLRGIALKLLDTAGIRETADVVEQIGVEKSKTALAEADLILLVLNANDPLHEDELGLLEELSQRQALIILNKTDLPEHINIAEVERRFPQERLIRMEAKRSVGIDELEQAIERLFFSGKLESEDQTYVSNARHIQLLKLARKSLADAVEATEAFVPIDIIQIDLRTAWEQLGEIIGDTAGDSLLDQIFSQFCLGK